MDNWKIVNSTVLSKFGCQTQISNGVDRPDPTVHKYLKLKQVNLFNEKKNRQSRTTCSYFCSREIKNRNDLACNPDKTEEDH